MHRSCSTAFVTAATFTSTILLLLLGSSVISAQNCSQPSSVPNARLLDQKDVYQEGDVISFACDMGYTSGRPIRQKCTDKGWEFLHTGACRLKPCVLPDDIPNGYYEIINGEDYVFGTTIKYFCNEGYQMTSREHSRTCLVNGWSNHLPTCESLSCDAPPPTPGVTVGGLSVLDEPILPDRFLTFSCDAPGSVLNGSETVVCGKDGKWDEPFPSCVEVWCELPEPNKNVRFLEVEGSRVMAGNRITVFCVKRGRTKEVECLSTGHWSSTIPNCRDTCDVLDVPDSVLPFPNVRQRNQQQSLRFRCKEDSHILLGTDTITCLEDGQWSHPFPSCKAPLSCQAPPFLENGDFLPFSTQSDHNTRVEYQCQSMYVMRGGPYKTCFDGAWIGEITCLKPCTVSPHLMEPNQIKFKWTSSEKLYTLHGDLITFACVGRARHDGQVQMRQRCVNGEMDIPRCV